MSSVLWQAIGYACGISLGILGLIVLVNVLVEWLDRRETPAKPTEPPEPCSTTEGSPSA